MTRLRVIAVVAAAVVVVVFMAFTGPRPDTEVATAIVTRTGGVCLPPTRHVRTPRRPSGK
jgi:hypothetical protein